MSKPDFQQDDFHQPFVQQINYDLYNSIPTTGRYWAFIILTALVLMSYQLVGSFAILYESGSFYIPQMYYTKSSRGADKYNTFNIFMFCCWQYVVVHEIAHNKTRVGKFIFIIFTLISSFIGLEFIFATPDNIIPLELVTGKGINFFKNGFRLVVFLYQIICFAIILTFLITNNRLIISPYDESTKLAKNMSTFPVWFPFVALIVAAIFIAFISGITGHNLTVDSDSSSSAEVVPFITTTEVKTQIESIFLRYTEVNLVDVSVRIEEGSIVHMNITIEKAGYYWENSFKSIGLELREIAPSATIWFFDTNSTLIHQV